MSVLPDQQLVYRDALEDRFSELLNDRFGLEREDMFDSLDPDSESEYKYLCEMWAETNTKEPLVYDSEYIEEAWGPDYEEGIEVMNHAMDKDIADEIRRKEDFLKTHFGENNG